jgi:hypothetical protein
MKSVADQFAKTLSLAGMTGLLMERLVQLRERALVIRAAGSGMSRTEPSNALN